jgi:beta-glucosidase
LDAQDITVVNNLKSAGIPVVVLVISGRPLVVNEILPKTDALLAAFLPGTEGQGITDILFGDYSPTGKLSFSWPRSNEQLPQNINMPEEAYDPLFSFGYGLSY